jgi:predicted transposase/invertase (TIGR01784 family)
MLDILKKSKKWVSRYEKESKLKIEKDEIRKEAMRLGKEKGMKKGMKERSLEMGKTIKKKGKTVETISEYTGISREEIEKI